MINQADLDGTRWNETPRPRHETVFHLPGATQADVPRFLGSGAVLCCLLDAGVEDFLDQQAKQWLPRITDPAFRAHSFYIPFLDTETLHEQSADALLAWTGHAAVYLRELPEAGGIFIVTKLDVLHALGRRLEVDDDRARLRARHHARC